MNVKTIVKWGILLGVAEVIGTQMLTWLGLGLTNWFIIMMHVLTIVFVILSLKDLKKQTESKINFLHAVILVFCIVLIARLIFQIYMFIYINYIDPMWLETVAISWTTTLQEQNYTQDQIGNTIESFRNSYKTIPMFTSALLMYAIPFIAEGIIIAAVYLFITKKI